MIDIPEHDESKDHTDIIITCNDKYEAQKLASLIFTTDCDTKGEGTRIASVLNTIDNEVVISIKDGSAHSILLYDTSNVVMFADFVQSVTDGYDVLIMALITNDNCVMIAKRPVRALVDKHNINRYNSDHGNK